VAQKSRTGRAFLADTWVDQEFETLRLLSDAGASVPKPIARNGQALLISYIGEAFRPAPLLQHSKLERHEAEPMFKKLLDDIELWLSCGRVHADLSPFNILYWAGVATVIDFPQAIDPMTNGNARRLLTRDIGNVCRYFAAYGIRADPEWIAAGMWRRQQIDERLLFGEFRSDAAIFDQNGNHFP
jgi:RIO kinase 1